MKPTEIITADAQSKGVDPQPILQAIAQAVQAKKGVILQENNTVLFLLGIGPDKAEVHIFTQDRPVAVGKAIASFIPKAQEMGIKFIYGTEEPAQTLALLKFLGIESEPSDLPKYKWMARI